MKRIHIISMMIMLAMGAPVSCYAQSQGTSVQAETKQNSQVATAEEMAAPVEVVDENMIPVYPEDIQDGKYDIKVDSSSSMFNIEKCELTVENGSMTAVMTMGGKGYLCIYMGTGEEAIEASEDSYIRFEEDEDGKHSFHVPVEALDKGIPCAAFSKNKKKWYDRTIVFKANSLPQEALKNLKITALADLNLETGTYEIEAQLSGGAGHTKLENPCVLTIQDGCATAEIVIASKNYDYILINDEKYMKTNETGNSAFVIPVSGFDYAIPVKINSVALGKPIEMDFTICFDSKTIK